MHLEWTHDPGAFLTTDWTELAMADPDGSIFNTPRYLELFWEELGAGRLLVGIIREGSRTIGVAPLHVGADGLLAFVGGFEVTDYMGAVALPEARERVAKTLLMALADRDDWRSADLRGLRADGAWVEPLVDAAEGAGLHPEVHDDGAAPFVELPGSYEGYLAALPGKLRHELRRKGRRLREAFPAAGVRHATPETLEPDFDAFVSMHRSSQGPKGRFMRSGMERFFRRLTEELLPEGTFRLSFLEAEGERLAATVAFRDRGRLLLYNSAFDHRHRGLSPGIVLIAELIRGAIEEGCESFDFLKDDLTYKSRFGARPRRLARLTLARA